MKTRGFPAYCSHYVIFLRAAAVSLMVFASIPVGTAAADENHCAAGNALLEGGLLTDEQSALGVSVN